MPKRLAHLDRVFVALADPTRRAVIVRLRRGPASVSELARGHRMALPSFLQHLGVLERGGLVRSHKRGRVRTYQLEPKAMQVAGQWLERQSAHWTQRLDQLNDYLLQVKAQ